MEHLRVVCLFVMLYAFCQGTNADWNTASNGHAPVARFLLPPNNVEASEITHTSVKLTWAYDTPWEVSYYVIYHRVKNSRQAYNQISRITNTYYDIQDLSPETEYEFIISAVGTDNRRGYPSHPVTATTRPKPYVWATTTHTRDVEEPTPEPIWESTTEYSQPEVTTQGSWWYPRTTTERRPLGDLPVPPEDVQVSRYSIDFAVLTWSYPKPDDSLTYTIYYKPKQSSAAYSELSGITTTQQRVGNLRSGTQYVFLVVGVNKAGRGLPSTPVTMQTVF